MNNNDETETKFERWRHLCNTKGVAPSHLRNFVWEVASRACGALIRNRAKVVTRGMTYEEYTDFHTDVVLMFLTFIKENNQHSVGWCFKAFRMRFSALLTRLEAKKMGLGLKYHSGIQSSEVRRVQKQLQLTRTSQSYDPLLSGLRLPAIEFKQDRIEEYDGGFRVVTEGENHV